MPRHGTRRRLLRGPVRLVAVCACTSACYASDPIEVSRPASDAAAPVEVDASRIDASTIADASIDAAIRDAGADAGVPKLGCGLWAGTLSCGAVDLQPNVEVFLNLDLAACGMGFVGIADATTDSNGDAYFEAMPVSSLLDHAHPGPFPSACAGRRSIVLTDVPGVTVAMASAVFP